MLLVIFAQSSLAFSVVISMLAGRTVLVMVFPCRERLVLLEASVVTLIPLPIEESMILLFAVMQEGFVLTPVSCMSRPVAPAVLITFKERSAVWLREVMVKLLIKEMPSVVIALDTILEEMIAFCVVISTVLKLMMEKPSR